MSFIEWKKSYQKDRVCNNTRSIIHWLKLRNEKMIPELENAGWVCKERKKLYMIQYKLFLHVIGFEKKYKSIILSLDDTDQMIHDAYFNIFGNICIIHTKHSRIMEYPHNNIIIQKHSIWATVKPRWKQERSGYKITRFLKKCCNEKRRRSLTSFEQINYTKLHLHNDSIPSISSEEAQKYITENLEKTILQKGGVDTAWSSAHHHYKIVQYFVQNKSKNVKKPRLMLVFGMPGSGKNWVLDKKRGKNHVIINVDDCRALLPNYWKNMIEKNHKDNEDWIRFFHKECNSIAKNIFNYALNNRMNIIWNGTGKNLTKYRNLIKMAKRKDYTIELRYIWVPISLARSRVHRRASIIGRNVPEEVLLQANKKIPETFKQLRIDADYARIYNNTVKSPIMVWDKDQGWQDHTPRKRKSISDTVLKI